MKEGDARPGPVRRLYDWMLGWADTPHGPRALAGLAFAESSIFPIPPDPLLIALALGAPRRALRFAAICTIASVVGGVVGYFLGMAAWGVVGDFFLAHVPGVDAAGFEAVRALYERWGFWAVFVAGLTPIPYKVFTLASGVFAISFPIFLGASAVSRGLRFFVVAGLIRVFGASIQRVIDRWFNVVTWVFAALVIGGFLAIELAL
ncbi:MAG: YqaA family protein [Longimicrobiales bacterium]|nr:YqaA family protein [Longimicrobiales bacterium]